MKKLLLKLYFFVMGLLLLTVGAVAQEPLLFLSTQLNPPQEAGKMRQEILKDFPYPVDYLPYDDRAVFNRLAINGNGETKTPSLLGGLHGDFVSLYNMSALTGLADVLPHIKRRKLSPSYLELGKFGQSQNYYVPWMQATYIMAANRKALAHLPEGADINNLTYDQLRTWAENIKKETGAAKLGFPVGSKGLMHRFFQGYLYPSFTGGMAGNFKSAEAVEMWTWFRGLWKTVNTRSLSFTNMSEPLLSEDVWIAWDHTARLLQAMETRPDDFIAFPAPIGPKGRGFLVVLAGLAIPQNAPNREAAGELITYLTQPEVQLSTLRNVGFFPVLTDIDVSDLPAGLASIGSAVTKQAAGADALPAMLPVGLGKRGREFNVVYLLTFSQIVLRGANIEDVLAKQGQSLSQLLHDVNAPCWPPDAPSEGPCPVN
ncbi:extracellular solute-binding protein [Pseudomonadota bacterium]